MISEMNYAACVTKRLSDLKHIPAKFVLDGLIQNVVALDVWLCKFCRCNVFPFSDFEPSPVQTDNDLSGLNTFFWE